MRFLHTYNQEPFLSTTGGAAANRRTAGDLRQLQGGERGARPGLELGQPGRGAGRGGPGSLPGRLERSDGPQRCQRALAK